jgi:hypothetical protein
VNNHWFLNDQHTHVKTTSNTGTGEGLVSTVLLTDGHKTGHLNLGELDLTATEGGKGLKDGQWLRKKKMGTRYTYEVSDLELLCGSSHYEDMYSKTVKLSV